MKKLIILFILIPLFSIQLQAQETIIDLQADRMLTLLKFEDNATNYGQYQDHTYNYSINLSTQLYKRLYLRTGFGGQNFSKLRTTVNWKDNRFFGEFHVKQQYLEILPTLRYGDERAQSYFGLGVGASIIHEAEYNQLQHFTNSHPDLDLLSQQPRFEGVIPFFTMALGINYFINEYLGVKLAVQYRNTGYTKKVDDLPRIGFDQGGFILGISYKFKHHKVAEDD